MITTNAFNHALRLIKYNYPDLPTDLQMKRAAELAEKICRKKN